MASNIDVPKVLGDIFESVAGAIFVDCEMSLDAVWRSYLPFLSSDMGIFAISSTISLFIGFSI
jgi:endoribonuclease Dicer